MNKNEYLSIIEGMIFLSGDEGISVKQIGEALELSLQEVMMYVDELIHMYQKKEVKGFEIVNYGGYLRW